MSATRVLRDSGAVLSHAFYADGVAVAADGAVTVSITQADGTVLTSGNATLVAGPPASYTFVLADQPLLNRLTVTWTGTFSGVTQSQTDTVEIVGKFYVPLKDLASAVNMSGFTTAQLVAALGWFEQRWEDYVGAAFVPRYARDRVHGNGRASLLLPHWPMRVDPITDVPSVYSVRTYTAGATYTTFTAPELAELTRDESGGLRRFGGSTFTAGHANVVVEYEHCATEQAPPDIADAALVAVRQKLLRDKTGDRGNRQYGVATEGVFVRNVAGPFFNDELNALAEDYRRRWLIPAVA